MSGSIRSRRYFTPFPVRGFRLAAFFLVLLGVAIMASGREAHADYEFCNQTSYVLSSAIAFQKDEDWKSQGWYQLNPGDCRTILRGEVKEEAYYVFARSADHHKGGRKYFSGSDRFCTVRGDFLVTGRENCAARGFDSNDFTRVDTKPGKEWSTSFMEPRSYSLKQAKIAGIQRLLVDNDYRNIKIDGYDGRSTRRAIMAFQRSINVNPDGNITEALYTALSAAADKKQQALGLQICNRTDNLTWAAVGYETSDGEVSSGWLKIEPDRCAKAIKGKLDKRYYYAYAEAVDGNGIVVRENDRDLVWAGDHAFCTKSTKFDIKDRTNCQDRGFTETGFQQIDTGEAESWTLELR